METKHTPGPWNYEKIEDSTLHYILGKDGEVLVGRTSYALKSEANAKLIASAPDLLEALMSLLYKNEFGAYMIGQKGDTQVSELVYNAIKKAIE